MSGPEFGLSGFFRFVSAHPAHRAGRRPARVLSLLPRCPGHRNSHVSVELGDDLVRGRTSLQIGVGSARRAGWQREPREYGSVPDVTSHSPSASSFSFRPQVRRWSASSPCSRESTRASGTACSRTCGSSACSINATISSLPSYSIQLLYIMCRHVPSWCVPSRVKSL